MKRWAIFFCELIAAYVAPRDDDDAEELVDCLRRLRAVGDIDLGDRAVSYRVASELARARVAAGAPRRGNPQGVLVSHVGAVRPMPWRVVFACGLGEGRYPASDPEDALDLRWAQRRQGDVTARERDKYAFLEVLLGARERLVLSYVSRDPLTGDPLGPSSVVEELSDVLGRGYVRDVSSLRRRHPLRRWDPCYFPELFPGALPLGTMVLPEARAEAKALALRAALEAQGLPVDLASVRARAADDAGWARVAQHLAIPPLPEGSAPPPGARVVVPMYALVKFLEFPLQGWARFRVGLDELDEDDALAREDEPFETDLRDETLLLRGILLAASKGGPLEAAYDEAMRGRELRGSGPSGVFATAERAEHLETLAAWASALDDSGVPRDRIELHRFGRAGEHATADRAHPALALEVDVADAEGRTSLARVEIGGRTLPLGGSETSITLMRRAKETADEWTLADRKRAVLRAFVDHAVLTASGAIDPRPRASLLVVATPRGPVVERVSFAPLGRGEAVVWLRSLVRELLGGPHAYFLPCEAVFVHRGRGEAASIGAAIEEARDRLGDGDGPPALRSAYGPVPRPHAYPAPPEAEARAMIARRFGALFERWEEP